jgi:hypothetical protein
VVKEIKKMSGDFTAKPYCRWMAFLACNLSPAQRIAGVTDYLAATLRAVAHRDTGVMSGGGSEARAAGRIDAG